MSESQKLKVIVSPCNSGMCPTLYSDETGNVFVQGLKISPQTRETISVSDDEEVVQIAPEILSYLKAF